MKELELNIKASEENYKRFYELKNKLSDQEFIEILLNLYENTLRYKK